MSATTSSTVASTSVMMSTSPAITSGDNHTSTPSTSSQEKGFCFSCGFNFGHIADGIEDTTMGMILVAITILVIVTIASVLSCYLGKQCCCKSEKKKYKSVSSSDSKNPETEPLDKDDDDSDKA